jgi:deoxyribodipyrimidine photolyase
VQGEDAQPALAAQHAISARQRLGALQQALEAAGLQLTQRQMQIHEALVRLLRALGYTVTLRRDTASP